MLQAGSFPDEVIDFFFFYYYLILPPALCPTVGSASIRNDYQEFSWGDTERPARKADNLTAICEPIVLENVGTLTSHKPTALHGLL
jgi:hypothetical protein